MSVASIDLVLRENRRMRAARDHRQLTIVHPADVDQLSMTIRREADEG